MDTGDSFQLESKAGIPLDAAVTHSDMMRAFDAFKETNDTRLAAIERYNADVLLEEKLARIDEAMNEHARRLDDIALRSARPSFGQDRPRVGATEHKTAFDMYVRLGEVANLKAIESKAFSMNSNPDGGFLVPPEIELQIGQRLAAISPIRSIAGVRTISSNIYR